jgi:hypothetical protein
MKMAASLLVVFALSIAFAADAALIDRGRGMIYDTVLDVTWLKNANYAQTSCYDADGRMTWAAATAWADQLTFGGYTDWRLPAVSPVKGAAFDFSWANDGSTDQGYNITSTSSELMYMFYVNLKNPGARTTTGETNPTWGSFNVGVFQNLYRDPYHFYWSGIRKDLSYIVAANYYAGSQTAISPDELGFAWAVRDGDIANVPAPAAAWLLGTGLIGLAVLRRKRKINCRWQKPKTTTATCYRPTCIRPA